MLYSLVFIFCSLTLLYNNNESVTNNNGHQTTPIDDDYFQLKFPFLIIQSNLSSYISYFLNLLRTNIEHSIINLNILNRPNDLFDLLNTAVPIYPIIIYTLACFLILRSSSSNKKHNKQHHWYFATTIWLLIILLIALNYDRYLKYLKQPSDDIITPQANSLVNMTKPTKITGLKYVFIIVPLIQVLA